MDVELVHATTHDEHLNWLKKVFRAQEGVCVKRNNVKYQYFKNRVVYLEHLFTSKGAQPNLKKVRAPLDALCPSNIKEGRSYV